MSNYLDTKEVAEMIKISPNTLAAWRSAGKGPPYMQIGKGVVRYKSSDVEGWMATLYADDKPTEADDVFEEPVPTRIETLTQDEKVEEAEKLLASVEDLTDLTTQNLLLILSALSVEVPPRPRKEALVKLVLENLEN